MAFKNRPRGWERTTKRILARDGYTCRIPGCQLIGQPATTVDHIVPRSKGGSHEDYNLRAAHRSCNSRIGRTHDRVPDGPVRSVRRGHFRNVVMPAARPSRWA